MSNERGVNYAKNKRRSDKRKDRRQENLQSASDRGWQKYTEHHWFKAVGGEKLEYWPSTQKVSWRGEIIKNVIDIEGFINSLNF